MNGRTRDENLFADRYSYLDLGMERYNATLIQDVENYLIYLEPLVIQAMSAYPVRDYHTKEHVYEWIIREEIEVLGGLNCVGHNPKWHVCRKIANRVDRNLPMSLNTLTQAYIQFPKLYTDNTFIQVDLKGHDLYIQYYRYGMHSALSFF